MLIIHYDMLQETCTFGLKNSAVRNLKPEYAKRTRLGVFVYAGTSAKGARQFVENRFADTTIGRIRLLVDATFRQVRHLVEKNSQVRHSVEIVKSLFFDQTSYSTVRRIYQMLLIIKKSKS